MIVQKAMPPETIKQIVHTIVENFQPDRVILFGSRARGEADPESDLDLLIEMETELPKRERARRIRRAFTVYPCPMDIIVYTPAEMKHWAAAPASFAATVLREGKILYERN
jgi:predicted nucleotidyltransferase